ncbi:class A beta-lactamase-related serine hydrolase, partial [Klebsiella pneumoniae]|nr:class A beta-lactamase-related serine hydrolase [Klebsiella pneumoniae]
TGLHVSALDLATLMIILSDNTATNLLIKRVGMDNVNRRMRMLGCQGITLRRLLFDSEASARGIENTVTAYDIALLLRKMQEG